jgi:Fe-S-cluster containining protein
MMFVAEEAEEMGISFVEHEIQGTLVYTPRETYKKYRAYVDSLSDDVKANPKFFIELIKKGEAPKFVCEFFVRDNGVSYCSIYEKRPWGCHIYGPQKEAEFRCINLKCYE